MFLFFPAAYWNVDVDWLASTFFNSIQKIIIMACNNCYLSQILKPTAYSLNDDSHHDDNTKNNDSTSDVEGRSQ